MPKAEKQSEHYEKMNLVVPFSSTACCRSGLAKARAIFSRNQKRLDHVGATVVAIRLVELLQPEIVTLKAGIGRFVRVALQVAKILLQDKRRVPFALRERLTLSQTPQHLRSRSRVIACRCARKFRDRCCLFVCGERATSVCIQLIYEFHRRECQRVLLTELGTRHEVVDEGDLVSLKQLLPARRVDYYALPNRSRVQQKFIDVLWRLSK